MIASVLLVARSGATALEAQLQALAACDLDGVEVVVVCDAPDPDVAALVDRLEGDVVLVRLDRPAGRRRALAEAARVARADVCVTLGATARPTPGFLAPLVTAVRGGAALAAPVLRTPAGDVHGYRAAPDGSLWPLGAGDAASVDALAFDCLAAPAAFLVHHLARFDERNGFHETQVAALARRLGPVVVVPGAVVERASVGPLASVVVATRNRIDEIGECIDALVAHGVLAAGGEVVVVDNGSTDGSDAVAAERAERHGPGVRLVREPVSGVSRAWNAGAAAARHELVVLCDDDARPAPGWYEALRDAFEDPTVAMAGGPIRALWPEGLDPGLADSVYLGYLSILERGDADLDVVPPGCVYGANWAIRRDALLATGGFPESLGPSAERRINGAEVAVEFAVSRLGLGRSRYVAAAVDGHRIPHGRMSEEYLQRRSFWCGVELPLLRPFLRAGDLAPVLRAQGEAAAATVFAAVQLAPEVDVDDAFAAIVTAPLPFGRRMAATSALGELVGCATLLERRVWELPGGTVVRVRPEHALGHLRPVAVPAAAG